MITSGDHNLPDYAALFAKVIDGRASADQLAEVDALLQSDSRARQLWLEFVGLEAGILNVLHEGESLVDLARATDRHAPARPGPVDVAPSSAAQRMRRDRLIRRAAERVGAFVRKYPVISSTVAALFLLTLIGALSLLPQPGAQRKRPISPTEEAPFIAKLRATHEVEWDMGQSGTTIGAHLQAGQHYELPSGWVEIQFRQGATIVAEGPADFTLSGPNEMQLHRGKLAAEVAPGARGFQVAVPTGRVVDLGTAFGVEAQENGATKVHCFRGSIRYQPSDGSRAPVDLAAGEGVSDELSARSLEYFEADIAQFVPSLRLRGRLPVGEKGLIVDSRFTNNVAVGKPARQSSTYNPKYEAGWATDGDSTNFTHTAADDVAPWLQVDLLHPHDIDAIIVHNRDDCCGVRLQNIFVDIIARDGETVVFASRALNSDNHRNAPQYLAVGLPEETGDKVRGRYVRIRREVQPGESSNIDEANDQRILSVGEVQVFADRVLQAHSRNEANKE